MPGHFVESQRCARLPGVDELDEKIAALEHNIRHLADGL